MNHDDMTLIRQCPAYAFARTLLERQQPLRPVCKPNRPVSLAHLSHVVSIVYGARIAPATWAVAFADLGVRVTSDAAHVCESLTLDFVGQTWGDRRLTDCYGDKFAHYSDLPAEGAAPAVSVH